MPSGTVSDECTMTKPSDKKVQSWGTPPTVSRAGHLLSWTLRWLPMHRCTHSLHSSWWCLARITLPTWRPGFRKVKEPARGLHSNGKELLMQPVLSTATGQETEDGIGITFGIQQVKHYLQFCCGSLQQPGPFPIKGHSIPLSSGSSMAQLTLSKLSPDPWRGVGQDYNGTSSTVGEGEDPVPQKPTHPHLQQLNSHCQAFISSHKRQRKQRRAFCSQVGAAVPGICHVLTC